MASGGIARKRGRLSQYPINSLSSGVVGLNAFSAFSHNATSRSRSISVIFGISASVICFLRCISDYSIPFRSLIKYPAARHRTCFALYNSAHRPVCLREEENNNITQSHARSHPTAFSSRLTKCTFPTYTSLQLWPSKRQQRLLYGILQTALRRRRIRRADGRRADSVCGTRANCVSV